MRSLSGGDVQGVGARLAGSGVDEMKVGLAVGTVQADEQVIASVGMVHCLVGFDVFS